MLESAEERTPGESTTRLALTQIVRPVSLLKGVFCILGIGVLVPWNAFISAKDYFQARFCMAHMESSFVFLFTLSSVVAMGVILTAQWWHEKRRPLRLPTEDPDYQDSASNEEKTSQFWFVQLPLATYVGVFTTQALMVTSISLSGVAGWTVLSLIISGVANVVVSAGIVAVAGSFTQADWAMNPYLQGQSLGGLVVSLANFAAAVSKNPQDFWERNCPNNLYGDMFASQSIRALIEVPTCGNYHSIDWGMFVYFLLAALILVVCLIGYSMIEPLRSEIEGSLPTPSDATRESQRTGVELLRSTEDYDEDDANCENHSEELCSNEERQDVISHATYGAADVLLRVEDTINTEPETVHATQVLWLIRGPTTCIFTTFLVTLALFPGWTSELTSVSRCKLHFRLANDLYVPFTFVVFNAGDLLGRLIAGRCLEFLRHRLVTASLTRVAFIPLLLSCSSVYSDRFDIPSDLYSFLVQMAFSVSNGLLLTASFAHAPSLITTSNGVENQMNQRMSEILSFAVSLGLLGGSLLSFPVSSLLAPG